MGTIVSRERKGGTKHTAQIRIKRNGVIVYTESQTFDRKQAAEQWMRKRESQLAEPGGLDSVIAPPPPDPTLAEVIDQYIRESKRDYGKTKKQVLNSIKGMPLGGLRCSKITSKELLEFAQSLDSQPQTVGNYMSHLASIFAIAHPAWGYPLDRGAMESARIVTQRMGVTSRSKTRTRRPTLDELDKILTHFGATRSVRCDSIPMQEIVAFAIFSTRRQDEITRMVFEDMDVTHEEIWVRDMKHPGEKIGNDVMTKLTPQALALVLKRRKTPDQTGRIFPHNSSSISTAFTRACEILGIEDLHFHDLRHEGISRLFEMGWNIPQVSQVSGHRTWTSLKRYTHIRQSGDKYAGWVWLDRLGIAPQPAMVTPDRPSAPDQSAHASPSVPA